MQGSYTDVAQITCEMSAVETITATMSATESITCAVGIPEIVQSPAYQGSYTITPTAETQTISTRGFRMTSDLTINPIPDNYGLITWNGSTLTVS